MPTLCWLMSRLMRQSLPGQNQGRWPIGASHRNLPGAGYFGRILKVGVPTGASGDRVGIVDVAPTLARLAGLAFPDGLDGHPLLGSED